MSSPDVAPTDPQSWPHAPPAQPPSSGAWVDGPRPAPYGAGAPPYSPPPYSPPPSLPPPLPPSPAPRPLQRWGCGDIVYGLAIAIGLELVVGIPLVAAGADENSLSAIVVGSLALWLGLAGWPLFCSWVRGLGSLKLDFSWAFRWYDFFIGLGLTATMLAIGIGLSALQRLFSIEEVGNTQFLEDQQEHGAGWAYVGLILLVALGAPLVEELFFRGLTYSALDRRFGAAVAVIGSSLVFGVLHFQPGPLVPTLFLVLNLTLFGGLLGLSRMIFKRTGPGVFAHMFFNLTAALVILAGTTGG